MRCVFIILPERGNKESPGVRTSGFSTNSCPFMVVYHLHRRNVPKSCLLFGALYYGFSVFSAASKDVFVPHVTSDTISWAMLHMHATSRISAIHISRIVLPRFPSAVFMFIACCVALCENILINFMFFWMRVYYCFCMPLSGGWKTNSELSCAPVPFVDNDIVYLRNEWIEAHIW